MIVAPAMNVNMWNHPATRANIKMLRERGVHVVDPDEGYLACGMVDQAAWPVRNRSLPLCDVLHMKHDLEGETVLVTAGPTCEDLDPVRYLTNRSSGKMGYALARSSRPPWRARISGDRADRAGDACKRSMCRRAHGRRNVPRRLQQNF